LTGVVVVVVVVVLLLLLGQVWGPQQTPPRLSFFGARTRHFPFFINFRFTII
jgi:hypothetical protein